jgi:membrane protein
MIDRTRAVVVEAVRNFIADESLQQAASLSYYALLSMAPLLLVVVGIAGLVFADETVQTQLIAQLRTLAGSEGALVAETVLRNADIAEGGLMSLLAGAGLALVGATTVFGQLQTSLNRIWNVRSAPGSAFMAFLRHRLLSAALVISLGFLLMVSLVVSAILAALHDLLDTGEEVLVLWELANLVLSLGMIAVLFALLLKFLPDAIIEWRDVWLGAAITALLFVIGKWLIGLYLGQASIGSWFGAAGSIVVLMVWTYYASAIFLIGAEITRSVARCRRGAVEPARYAQGAGR